MVPIERSIGYVVREMRQRAHFCKREFRASRAWQQNRARRKLAKPRAAPARELAGHFMTL
jgi:hypothetical protein